MTGVISPLVSTSSAFSGAATPVLLPRPSESQHVSAEPNALHSLGQAAAVSPGLAGMSCEDRPLCPSWNIRLNMKQQENMKHASERGPGCKGHKGFVVFKHRAESLKLHFVCEKEPWEKSVMHWEYKTKICFSS